MLQINIVIAILEGFFVNDEVSALNIFLGIIYTMVPKLLIVITITVWILDSSVIRNVSGDWTRFPDLIHYRDSCCIANDEQLRIKKKRNIDLSFSNTILKLSDLLYIPHLIVNLISTARLWHNKISIYFPASQLAELFF